MTLILLSGLPGSGKSTVAQEIHDIFGNSIVHYQNDVVRKELFSLPSYDMEETLHVLNTIHARARESLLSGKIVLIDGIYWRELERIELQELALRSESSFFLLHITADEDITRIRLANRSNTISDADFEVYRKLKPLFEPILMNHVTIKNNGTIHELREEVRRVLWLVSPRGELKN